MTRWHEREVNSVPTLVIMLCLPCNRAVGPRTTARKFHTHCRVSVDVPPHRAVDAAASNKEREAKRVRSPGVGVDAVWRPCQENRGPVIVEWEAGRVTLARHSLATWPPEPRMLIKKKGKKKPHGRGQLWFG